jgi:hypothetical protein
MKPVTRITMARLSTAFSERDILAPTTGSLKTTATAPPELPAHDRRRPKHCSSRLLASGLEHHPRPATMMGRPRARQRQDIRPANREAYSRCVTRNAFQSATEHIRDEKLETRGPVFIASGKASPPLSVIRKNGSSRQHRDPPRCPKRSNPVSFQLNSGPTVFTAPFAC